MMPMKGSVWLGAVVIGLLAATADASFRLPGPPTEVAASSGSSGTAVVRFEEPVDDGYELGERRYRVSAYAPPAGGGGEPVAVVLVTAPPAFMVGLPNGTALYFTVRSENTVGELAHADEAVDSNVVVIGAPAPPAYVETLPSNGSSVVLWGPAQSLHTPVTSFVISTDPPHAPDVTILAEDIGGGEMSINQTTTIHGLSNSVGYTFTVVAHNEIGASPPALSDVAYPLGG